MIAEVPEKNLKIKDKQFIDLMVSYELAYEKESIIPAIIIDRGNGGTL